MKTSSIFIYSDVYDKAVSNFESCPMNSKTISITLITLLIDMDILDVEFSGLFVLFASTKVIILLRR